MNVERTQLANDELRAKVVHDFLKADERLAERLYEVAGEAVANYVQLEFVFPRNEYDSEGNYIDRVAEDSRRWDVI